MKNSVNELKDIGDVVCAIIEQDNHFLIAQRPAGHQLEFQWEFPGGKVIKGESLQEALKREIAEELNVVIDVDSSLTPNNHSYEHITLILIPFRCSIVRGVPSSTEHSCIAWVNSVTVHEYKFADADIPILKEYLEMRRSDEILVG